MRSIHIIHPSRSRPQKSFQTIQKFINTSDEPGQIFVTISLDIRDPFLAEYYLTYQQDISYHWVIVENDNRNAVQAINFAAKANNFPEALIFVVSDDTDCEPGWDTKIRQVTDDKEDFILKTKDGIQEWILTNPILDNKYYQRFGYVYDPDFAHQFVDTWMSVQADISGRKLTSNIMFRHLNGEINDEVRKKSDATWSQGERTFIQKLKQTPIEDLKKITDLSMRSWIRNKAGIRI